MNILLGLWLNEGNNEIHFPYYVPQWYIAGSWVFIWSVASKPFSVSKYFTVFGYLTALAYCPCSEWRWSDCLPVGAALSRLLEVCCMPVRNANVPFLHELEWLEDVNVRSFTFSPYVLSEKNNTKIGQGSYVIPKNFFEISPCSGKSIKRKKN